MSAQPADAGRDGRLAARPGPVPPGSGPSPGLHVLDTGPGPDVVLRVPTGGREADPMRLVLTLHGAGGDARAGLAPLLPLADAQRLLLLAPGSVHGTWDAVGGGWGADVRRIDTALSQLFETCPVDTARLAVAGFSDGASYAISLGLANADLFARVIAFSPGFVVPGPRIGTPRVFVAHGRADTVLPIDRTTRRIVPRLQADGVPVEVREFEGGHVVPPDVAAEAVRWLV